MHARFHLRRGPVRALLREAPRLDPRTGVAGFALWAFWFGVPLALPMPAFPTSPVYAVFLRWQVPERPLGVVMMATAALLAASLGSARAWWFRVGVALLCGAFWTFVGALVLAGAWGAGLVSAAGGFSTCGGVLLFLAAEQWVRSGEGG